MSQIYVLTSPALPHDQAAAVMTVLDCAYHPEAVAVSMDETDEANALWMVQAYYDVPFDTGCLKPVLAGSGIAADDFELLPVPDTNWVAQSLEGLAPVVAGRFFVHGHHDRGKRPHFGICLELEAGMAFGTGHHGTTRGCLMALDAILKQGRPQRILDVGCGTGVLGIAAARATRRGVVMSDIDPQAVAVARENAIANQASGLTDILQAVGVAHRGIRRPAPYDLIFANILARPLVKLSTSLVQLCAVGGDIVLSGLYVHQERWVLSAYRNSGAILHKRICVGQWSTLWLKRAR